MNETMDVKAGMSRSEAAFWFWSVVLVFVGLWILLPCLFHPGYKWGVVELQFIGKEWVLADRKHPMLPAWLLETINIFTGRAFAAPFIASALCTVLTLLAVWRLARQVLSERLALIGTFVMLPFWAISVDSTKYNQNSVQLACWTLTIGMFYNAFQTNKKRWWLAAGLALGLGFHAKYTTIFLAVAILLYSLWIPRFRRYWKESGPWMTLFIAFAVFLPHLIWLYQTGMASTTDYALRQTVHRTGLSEGIISYFRYPLQWFVHEFALILISPLVLLIPCLGRKWKIRSPQSEIEKETLQYLLCCIAFPFLVFTLFTMSGTWISGDYGYTLYFFLGIYLLLRFQHQDSLNVFRRSCRWVSLAVLGTVVFFVVYSVYSPYLLGTPRSFHFPMRELGAEGDRIWSSHFDVPCPYTSGDWYYAGTAGCTMKDRPSVHFYYNTIADPEALPTGTWSTDEGVNQKGGIIFWKATDQTAPDWLHRRFPRAEVVPEILELPYSTGAKIPPLRIGVALIPPAPIP